MKIKTKKEMHSLTEGRGRLSVKATVKKAVLLTEYKPNLAHITNIPPIWMFPVLDKPLIAYAVNFLKKQGIENIAIVCPEKGNMPADMQYLVGEDIYYHSEGRPRGTAGILKDLESFLDHEPFLVMSTNLFVGQLDFEAFMKFHLSRNSVATVGVMNTDNENSQEYILIGDDNNIQNIRIEHFSVRRKRTWKSSGLYLFDPVVLRYIPKERYMDIKEQLIPVLQQNDFKAFAYKLEGDYVYVESMNEYMNMNRSLLLKDDYKDLLGKKTEIADKVWVGKNVRISPHAYLLGPLVIGDNCEVRDWAQLIGPSIIGHTCLIDDNVLIRESILWNNVSIAKGAKIEYSLITESAYVPERYASRNMVMINEVDREGVNLLPYEHKIQGIVDLSDVISMADTKQKIYKTVKRLIDMMLSLIGLIVLLPLFLTIAIIIKFGSKGPVLYRQKRCGIHGKVFDMLKFRTMVVDAESMQKSLLTENVTDGPMFKMIDDPRVTKVGALLRKMSLDELPQLYNVLRGQMSLVGPRPLIMDEMKFSPSWRDTRLKVKPGITGLWQVQGRSEASFHDWIHYDISYVKNQSLWLDVKILFKTIKVVLQKVGAY